MLQIAELAQARSSRPAARPPARSDIRCTVSIGGFVPKPHTPFQWAAQLDHEATDARLQKLRDAIRADKRYGEGDRLPLPRRQARHRRRPALPRRPPGRRGHPRGLGGRRPLRRLERALLLRPLDDRAPTRRSPDQPVDLDWYTTRERDAGRGAARGTTSTPAWTRTGSGRTGRTRSPRSRSTTAAGRRASTAASARDGHRDPDRPDRRDAAAADRRRQLARREPASLRPPAAAARSDRPARSPSTDGPPPPPAVQQLRLRYAKRGRLRFTCHRDFARAFERALRRADVPMAFSAGLHPAPEGLLRQRGADRRGQRGGVPRDRAAPSAATRTSVRAALDAALPPGLDVARGRRGRRRARLADRLEASRLADRAARRRRRRGRARRSRRSWPRPRSPVERMTKNGRAHASTPGPRSRRARRARASSAAATARPDGAEPCAILRRGRTARTHDPPFDPTTSSPVCASWPTSRRRSPPR